jgi:4-amino-4-deoxy-L-arabinose transferase-like glycosyltransferase
VKDGTSTSASGMDNISPRNGQALAEHGPQGAALDPRWGKALVLVLILRLGYFFIATSFPEGGAIIDSRGYLEIASTLRQVGWSGLDASSLHWTPGYPVFLLLAEGATGTTLIGAELIQLILTAAACLVLWQIGVRLGDPRAGMAGAWLYALGPNTALWSLTIMSETLFAFLVVIALYAWIRTQTGGGLMWDVATGAILGLAALVRPIGLLLIPIWAICGLFGARWRGQQRSRLLRMAALVGCSIVVLMPWILRNWSLTGRPVFAEVPGNTLVRFNLAYVVAEAEGVSRDEAARRLSGTVRSMGDGLEIIQRYPAVFVKQQLRGILRTAVGVESGVWARQLGYGLDRQGSFGLLSSLSGEALQQAWGRLFGYLQDPQTTLLASLFVLGVGHTATLWILALASLLAVFGWGRWDRHVYLAVALSVAGLIVVPGAAGQARFRIPPEPMLALLAGAGLIAIVDAVRRRRAAPGPPPV